jgi:hypothetical protein
VLVPGPATGQSMDYFALGDSVTKGKSYPELNCGETYTGGYPRRLDDLLLCPTCAVTNHGKDGDTTGEMLSRLSNILDDQDWAVMLLMGGTNDIFQSVSNNTIEANLREAASRAAEQGVDTVFASTIRFHELLTSSAKDSAAEDLRNRVSALANEQGHSGYFVDSWATLCPNSTCFANEYLHDCALAGQDAVGHPDKSGHDILADLFRDEIEKDSLPTPPTPVSPTGTGAAPTEFTWSIDPGDSATWYRLEVDGPKGNILTHWYQKEVCSGGLCSASPTLPSSSGNHLWRVRGRSPREHSAWSVDQAFEIIGDVPGPANPLSPEGDLFTDMPRFAWSPGVGATDYYLEILDDLSSPVFDQSYDAESTCDESGCSVVTGASLALSDYQWKITPQNTFGNGPVSAPMLFSRVACSQVTLELDNQIISTPELFEACETIHAGDLLGNGDFVVSDGGEVTLHAGDTVVLEDGFAVLDGGELVLRVDPQ